MDIRLVPPRRILLLLTCALASALLSAFVVADNGQEPAEPQVSVKHGVLPPYDQVPLVLTGIVLTSKQQAELAQLRIRFQPRYRKIDRDIIDNDGMARLPFLAARKQLEKEQRDTLRSLLAPEQQRPFDANVNDLLARRRGAVHVGPR
ncbi:MAG: hypothetical protein JWM95_4838 [Gemmatimonadetes bacterium]|nr:hypothetical protein [Gemmatimonadota bacterium]